MWSMLLFILGSFGVLQLNAEDTNKLEVSDHYWREYNGVIPPDAVHGGYDTAGRKTYIGQVFHKSYGLIPVTIISGTEKTIATIVGGWIMPDDNFAKILCSANKDKYRWIPVQLDDLEALGSRCHLVVGGTEYNEALFIGRIYHEMETIVGKIFPKKATYKGLFIAYKTKEVRYTAFDVLTYNCNARSENIGTSTTNNNNNNNEVDGNETGEHVH